VKNRISNLVLALVVVTAHPACSQFDNLEPVQPEPPPEPCVHALPPREPQIGPSVAESVDFVVAVNRYDLGEEDLDGETQRYRAMGFDLDQTCTGQTQGPSCAEAPVSLI
jgi:hypothetical protein